jgi:hypothetical protein
MFALSTFASENDVMMFTDWQETFLLNPVEGSCSGTRGPFHVVDSRLIEGMTLIRNSDRDSLDLVVWWFPYSLRPTLVAFGGIAGFDPVLFAALVLVGVLVTHGRQITDDPRRGVSVEVRTVGDHGGCPVGEKVGDHRLAGEPDRTRQVLSRVRLLR